MAQGLSDNSSSTRVAIKRKYADLALSFLKHPGTGDIRPLNDLDAVKQSVKNLVLTNFGERPFHPEIGGNVTSYLFENANGLTSFAIEEEIKKVITEHEPRVNGVTIKVQDNMDANAFIVHMQYNVLALNVEVQSSFYLKRLR
jgi:phage baseplate assembly protein W